MLILEEEGLKQSVKIILTVKGFVVQTHSVWGSVYKDLYSLPYAQVSSVELNEKVFYTEFTVNGMSDKMFRLDINEDAVLLKYLIELGRYDSSGLVGIIGGDNVENKFRDVSTDDKLLETAKSHVKSGQGFGYAARFGSSTAPANAAVVSGVAPSPQPQAVPQYGNSANVPPAVQQRPAGPPKPKEFSFYAMIENKQRGPYNEAQFRRLVENDLADADTLVWQEGMDDWEPAGEVKMMRKLFPKAAPQQPAAPQMSQVAYYVNLNGQQVGPFNVQQLRHFASTGEFTPQLYVWREGMPNWELAAKVPELQQVWG